MIGSFCSFLTAKAPVPTTHNLCLSVSIIQLCTVSSIPISPTHSYVSRKHPKDSSNHEILGIQQVKPVELAQMATLDIGNSWGVLQAIVDVLRGFPRDEKTSKYLILKDPNKVCVDSPRNTVLSEWMARSISMKTIQ